MKLFIKLISYLVLVNLFFIIGKPYKMITGLMASLFKNWIQL